MERNSDDHLVRKLGLFPLTNIVIANMIGAGIFTTSGLLMTGLKNPLVMLLLWVMGGLIAFCGALAYGELGASFPHAGGEYVFLSRLFHPLLGFLSGWVSFFVGFSAPIAASAIGVSEYLARAFPSFFSLGDNTAGEANILLKKLIAVAVIALFTMIHLRGIDFGARVQNYLTILKVGLIVGLIFLGFLVGRGNWNHFFEGSTYDLGFAGWKMAALSLMWIMFAYSGWNASAYVGSEVRDPIRNLPFSLILGTGIVTFLYLCLNVFYIYGIPPEDMSGVISIGGLAVGRLFGSSFERVLSLLISFALFSSLSAYIILGPRVYYSMAKNGHFFRFVAHVHPRRKVPSKSILLQGLLAAVIALSGSFDQILTYMGFSLGIFPLFAVLGVFKLRRSGQSATQMPGFPVAPAVYLITGVLILFLAFLQRPMESLIAILTVLVGIPAYFLFKRKSRGVAGLTRDFG